MYLLHGPFVRGFACHDIHVRGGHNMDNEDEPLITVRPIYRTGVPLPSQCCILYIFLTNISTEYFKHAAHSPFFLLKKQFNS
jgi:hypothetical protein